MKIIKTMSFYRSFHRLVKLPSKVALSRKWPRARLIGTQKQTNRKRIHFSISKRSSNNNHSKRKLRSSDHQLPESMMQLLRQKNLSKETKIWSSAWVQMPKKSKSRTHLNRRECCWVTIVIERNSSRRLKGRFFSVQPSTMKRKSKRLGAAHRNCNSRLLWSWTRLQTVTMMPLRRPERWKSQCSGAFGENLVTLLLIIVARWPRLHGGAGIMYAPVIISTRVKAAIIICWSANSPPRLRWHPQRPSPQWSKPTKTSLPNP